MYTKNIKRVLPQIVFLTMVCIITGLYLYSSYLSSMENSDVLAEISVILPKSEISALVLDDDYIWAGGREGLYKIDLATEEVVYRSDSKSKMDYVRALLMDSSGQLWVGHDYGLSIYDGDQWQEKTRDQGLCDNRVYSIAEDSKQRIWVGTWNGVSVFEKGQVIKTYTREDGLLDNMVNTILIDQMDGVWFGSYLANEGGISHLSLDGTWSYLTTESGLAHSYVTSCLLDSKNQVWIGTGLLDKGGVSILSQENKAWILEKTLSKVDGLAGEKVRSVFESSKGLIWLGSEYDGLTIVSDKGMTILTKNQGLSDNEIKAMVQDLQGNMWLGSRNGITKIDVLFLDRF